jgi:hypothetical protein
MLMSTKNDRRQMTMVVDPKRWTGTIDELVYKANEMLGIKRKDAGKLTVRLIRDYLHRDLLGDVVKQGKEGLFTYQNLIYLLATRFLLNNGWPLAKIKDHFSLSPFEEVELLVQSPALRAIRQIKMRSMPPAATAVSDPVLKSAARLSSVQRELSDALLRLGVKPKEFATEELTLVVVAPWCQVSVQSDRIARITAEEAEDLGRAVTAAVLSLISTAKRKS